MSGTLAVEIEPDRGPAEPAGGLMSDAFSPTTAKWIDLVAAVVAVATTLMLLVDVSSGVRPPVALVFTLFVPGWTVARWFGAPATALTVVGSIAASVTAAMLIGQGLVLFGDWRWFPAGLLLGGVCSVCGLTTVWRETDDLFPRPRDTTQPRALGRAGSIAFLTVVAGNVAVVLGVRRSSVSTTDLLGLVDRLDMAYWIGLAIIVGGLLFALRAGSKWAWLNVTALLVALHGLPGLLERSPRFPVAWLHVGFIRHIAEHGTLLRNLDARFSWAGFFSGGAFTQRLTGTDSLLWMVRYAPLFYNVCAILVVIALARRFRMSPAQTVVAATLFCCLSWVGQDYLSPQATAFVLYWALVTVLLTAFPADPARSRPRMQRLLRPEVDTTPGIGGGRRAVALLAGCYLVAAGLVVSHQLTPGFLMSATFLLVIFGVIRLRLFPFVVALMFLAWLSLGADAYWSGHFATLTNSVGQVGSIVGSNVGKRTASTNIDRKIVINLRIALALVSWLVAGVSVLLQWSKRRTPVALACLFIAPFPMIALQPYGGEMVLRVCYFSLPAVVILIAQLAVPRVPRLSVRWIAGFGVAIAVLVPAFIVTRFGNEAFESVSVDDARLNAALYDLAPDGSIIYVESRQAPIYSERIGEVRFRNLPAGDAEKIANAIGNAAKKAPVFVLLTESQAANAITNLGRAPDWMTVLINELLQTGRFTIEAQEGQGVILGWRPA